MHETSHHHGPGGDHGAQAAHADHGIAKYLYVFVALCILTGASFFTYSSYWPFKGKLEHPTPQVAWVFMMAVSCTKAMLVVLFFMHVKYEANWKYVLTIPASMMSMFLLLALVPDIGARVNGFLGYQGRYSEERLEHVGTRTDVAALQKATAGLAAHHAQAGDH